MPRGVAPAFVAGAVAVAVVLLVVAVTLFLLMARSRARRGAQHPEPPAAVALLAPLGGIAVTPRAFTWSPVPAAASYKVTIADEDAVWPIFVRTTSATSLPLDDRDTSAIAPGRVHVWEVLALDASAAPVARGTGRFRVRPPGEDAGSEPLF